ATLLRHDSFAISPNPTTQPLFVPKYVTTADLYRNTDNNAYFNYQQVSRLSNLVTTRSSVFAVWITVGYFELEPNPTTHTGTNQPPNGLDFAHPEGFRLGQEVGMGTGQTVRHRAFYMIDRSIPVGYERGQDHNTWRTILVRRYIE